MMMMATMLSGAQYCPIITFYDDYFYDDEIDDEDEDNGDGDSYDVIRGSILSYYWRSS